MVAPLVLLSCMALAGTAAPTLVSPADEAPALAEMERLALAHASTVRVAGRTCDGLLRGSGFVVDGHLITNRHLVAGATEIKVDDPVAATLVTVERRATSLDLAVAAPVAALPLSFAAEDPVPGDLVWMVGHAGGGATQVLPGEVISVLPEGSFGLGGPVVVIDTATTPGFSGGPVLDAAGRVVAVLQGLEATTGSSLALPRSSVQDWLAAGDDTPPQPCPTTP